MGEISCNPGQVIILFTKVILRKLSLMMELSISFADPILYTHNLYDLIGSLRSALTKASFKLKKTISYTHPSGIHNPQWWRNTEEEGPSSKEERRACARGSFSESFSESKCTQHSTCTRGIGKHGRHWCYLIIDVV